VDLIFGYVTIDIRMEGAILAHSEEAILEHSEGTRVRHLPYLPDPMRVQRYDSGWGCIQSALNIRCHRPKDADFIDLDPYETL
jgi:hypothetical protein